MNRRGLRTTVWVIGLAVFCATASAAPNQQRRSSPPTNAAGQPVKDAKGVPLTYQKIEWRQALPSRKSLPRRQTSQASLAERQPTWTYVAFGTNIGGQGLTSATVGGATEIYATGSGGMWGGASYWYALTKTSTSLTDGLQQTYASAEFESSIVNLSVAKVAAGEQRIIVALQNGTLVQYDLSTKQVKDQDEGPCAGRGGLKAFTIGDLSGDGIDEFISICSDDTLIAHGPSYSTWSLAGVGGANIAVGQMDNDAAIEIATNVGKVVDSGSKTVQWFRSEGFGDHVLAGDIDGDGRAELLADEGWDWVNSYDVEKKLPKWSLEILSGDIDTIKLADVTGDGVRELLVGGGQWGAVEAYDMTTLAKIGEIDNPEHGVTNILVADVNGDGVSELLWGAGATSSGADHLYVSTWATKHIEWQSLDLTGPFVGPVVGDLDGDGVDEIAFASNASDAGYDSGRIIVLDSRTMAVRGMSAPVVDNQDWDGIRDIRLGDTDGNGRPEILIACSALEAYKFTRKNTFVRTASVTDGSESFSSVAAADLEGDGHIELLGGSSGFVLAYDPATGTRKWRSPVHMGGSARDLVIGDLDGDGALEFAAMAKDGKPYIHDGVTHELEALVELTGTSMSSVVRPSGLHLLVGDASGQVHELAYKNGTYVRVKNWQAAAGAIDGITWGTVVWVGSAGQLSTFTPKGDLRYQSVPLGGQAGRQVVRLKALGLDLTTGSMGLYGLPYTKQ